MRPAVDVLRARDGIRRPARVERAIIGLTDQQHGVVSAGQLLGVGLSREQIAHRISTGFLTPLHWGIFAAGRTVVGDKGRWMAATLAGGPRALLSHLAAAALWGIWPVPASRPEVTVPGAARRSTDSLKVHRMRRMHPDDASSRHGIPVTSIELTCLHLGSMLSHRSLERAVVKAARRPEFAVDRALALCERSYGRPGVKPFRRVVARDLVAELRALSELELRFLEVLRHHEIPIPEVNHDVESFMVDATWHEQRVIVELDGFEFHRLPRDLRRDNERTRRLVLAGYRVIRFVWDDVVRRPGEVADTVRALLLG